jgi:hypothetical protein
LAAINLSKNSPVARNFCLHLHFIIGIRNIRQHEERLVYSRDVAARKDFRHFGAQTATCTPGATQSLARAHVPEDVGTGASRLLPGCQPTTARRTKKPST